LRQPRPLGSGHAVWLAKTFTDDEPFLVAYGDCVIWEREKGSLLRMMVETFRRHRPAAVIAVQKIPVSQVSKYGVIAVRRWRDGVAEVTDIVEKPSPENAPSRYAVAARYLFAPAIYDALAATRPTEGEWQLTDAIRYLLQKGEKVVGVALGERVRLDVGNFADYFTAFLFTALHDPEVGTIVRQHLRRWLRRLRP
jgi:UTP--glucose-1-phosphate uridylyltransferase